jgi:hypothetical protein
MSSSKTFINSFIVSFTSFKFLTFFTHSSFNSRVKLTMAQCQKGSESSSYIQAATHKFHQILQLSVSILSSFSLTKVKEKFFINKKKTQTSSLQLADSVGLTFFLLQTTFEESSKVENFYVYHLMCVYTKLFFRDLNLSLKKYENPSNCCCCLCRETSGTFHEISKS